MTSREAYEELARAVDDWPAWAHRAIEALTEGGIVLLLVLVVAVTVRRRDPRTTAQAGIGIAATAAAYGASALLKLTEAQVRPCRALPDLDTIAACPPAGDWSLPSNHAVIAAGLAVAVGALVPRLAPAAALLAVAVAASRVALGVHYPHDVVTGLTLGAGVVAALMIALRPAVPALAMRIDRSARPPGSSQTT